MVSCLVLRTGYMGLHRQSTAPLCFVPVDVLEDLLETDLLAVDKQPFSIKKDLH